MTKIPTSEGAQSGVFSQTVAALDGGSVLSEIDDKLRELVIACAKAQKAGKLTLTLKVKPNGVGVDGETPVYLIEDDVKVSPPKVQRRGSSFFADEDHNLTRRNPGQAEMKLTVVSGGRGMVAEAAAAAAKTGTGGK